MGDLYGTSNDRSFSSSSSLESEDMSSFLQSFLNNSSAKEKYEQLLSSSSQISTDFENSDQRFSDLNSFYSTETNQVQKPGERRQNSSSARSSKRTRAAEIHNLSEKRRRSRINEKLKALQTLVPNSNKTDKASMLDEAIEYLKQLQLKVQTLTMRNGFGLPPVYSHSQEQEQEMQTGMTYNEGYKLPNPNQTLSMRREFGVPNHIGMTSSLTNMMKPDLVFGSEMTNENQFGFTNQSASMKGVINRPSNQFSGKIPSPGVSS